MSTPLIKVGISGEIGASLAILHAKDIMFPTECKQYSRASGAESSSCLEASIHSDTVSNGEPFDQICFTENGLDGIGK